MKEIEKYLKTLLTLSVILSVMLVAGIPMIIVGASNEIYSVMGIGIAFAALGFYGTPTAWAIYGANLPLKRVVYAVCEENLYTVSEIAQQLSMDENSVRGWLDKAFNKGYLKGFRRHGDVIELNDNVSADKRELAAQCPYCGAKFTYTADNARCPYCNSPVVK